MSRHAWMDQAHTEVPATRKLTWRDHLNNWPYASTVLNRLLGNLAPAGDCWIWQRHQNADGYGVISVKRMMVGVHCVAYHLFVVEVPLGLELDHLCRVRACANPRHLEPVTTAENTRRGIARLNLPDRSRQTHCIRGHAFDEANTYVHPRTGHRACRRCRADGMRKGQVA